MQPYRFECCQRWSQPWSQREPRSCLRHSQGISVKHEQAACILVPKEHEVLKVAECYRGDNSCRKFVVAHCQHQTSLAYSVDSHMNITFQSFIPGLVCCLSSEHFIPSQGWSFPVNVFLILLPSCHVPCHRVLVWCQCNFICCTLYFTSQIYGMESPIKTTQALTVWGLHTNTIT